MNFKKILKKAIALSFIYVAQSNAVERVILLPTTVKPLTINQIIGNLKAGVFKKEQKRETLYSMLKRWWHAQDEIQDKKKEKNRAKINPAFIAIEISLT